MYFSRAGSYSNSGSLQSNGILSMTQSRFGGIALAGDTSRYTPVSMDYFVRGMNIQVVTPAGTGNGRTFTLQKNGVDTAVSVTISGTNTSATWNGNLQVLPNDYITLSCTPTGTPTVSNPRSSLLIKYPQLYP